MTAHFSEPYITGYMSTNGQREYCCDFSQLKFITYIPRGPVKFDLNHNIKESVKRTTDENNERISLLLRFLLDKKPYLNFLFLPRDEPCIVTYRRTLITVMCSAFDKQSWSIIATLYKGIIYLCSVETQEDIKRRKSRSLHEKMLCAWGYKFEQYMLADAPNIRPNINRPVIENEEFSIYYSAKFGSHDIFYGAQIDGLLATDCKVLEPPEEKNFVKNLEYLRRNHFVELKTNREIYNRKQEQNFRRYKLLRCWCQCYLAGLKGLLVGFRNDEGIVKRLQWFDSEEIVDYCRREWVPRKALQSLDHFIWNVKQCLTNSKHYDSDEPTSLQFDHGASGEMSVKYVANDIILPGWYTSAFNLK